MIALPPLWSRRWAMPLAGVLLAASTPLPVGAEPTEAHPGAACASPLYPVAPQPGAQPAHPQVDPDQLRDAHRLATGAGVTVAVIDTGVSAHRLLPRLKAGPDLVDPSDANALRDCDGHGTIVAGIIAANPGHGDEPLPVGIAPDATLLSIRQSSAHARRTQGEEDTDSADSDASQAHRGTLASLATAIDAAVTAGARVINMSVVACVPADTAGRLDTSGLDAALSKAEAAGTVVIAAAGNTTGDCDATSVVYPAHSPTVLAVTATSDAHNRADYALPAAPGAASLAAAGLAPVALSPDGHGLAIGLGSGPAGRPHQATPFAGTSFAAPVIAGTAALIIQRHPDYSAADVRAVLRAAAQPPWGGINIAHATSTVGVPTYGESPAPARSIAPAHPADTRAARRATALSLVLAAASALGVVVAGIIHGSAPRRQRPQLT